MIATPTLPGLLRSAKRDGWADWIRSSSDERAVLDGYKFDLAYADWVRKVIRTFKHSKGKCADQPFELDEWQWREVIGPLFGWRRDGIRRFRTVYVEVPKKNGKSTLAAAIGLILTDADGEAGAEVYSVATKREQAAIVHDEAVRMFKSSPLLSSRFKLNQTTKTLSCEATDSKYAALASDGPGVEGINAHGLIYDELHVWSDRVFWDALMYATAARSQPVRFIITTAGEYDKTSIGWQEHEYAEHVTKDEVKNDRYLAYIRGATMKDDWSSAETHKMANPSYGSIIDPEEMMASAKTAADRPIARYAFMRYRLSIWLDNVEGPIDMAAWDECAGEVDEEELAGRPCYAGLDLASRNDLTAFVMIFPPTEDDPSWVLLPRLFCPQDRADHRQRSERIMYRLWAEQGHITLTEGNRVDYEVIRQQILDDGERFGIGDIGADRWNLEYLRQRLPDVNIVEYGQNYQDMSAPTKELIDALIPARTLRHNGSPVMQWMAANTALVTDGNENAKPSKKKSRDKIDGIVAAVMALGRAMVTPEAQESYYETHGLEIA